MLLYVFFHSSVTIYLRIDTKRAYHKILFNKGRSYPFRPDGLGTITVEERTKFEEIRTKLRALLEHQITHFRYVNIIVGSHNITMPEFQALKQLCSDMVSITTTYQ